VLLYSSITARIKNYSTSTSFVPKIEQSIAPGRSVIGMLDHFFLMRKDVGPGGREPVTGPSLYGLLTGLCAMRLLMGFDPWADSDSKPIRIHQSFKKCFAKKSINQEI
jgi:hypothetical protein